MLDFLRLTAAALLLTSCFSCTRDSTGIPAQGSYFTFGDVSRRTRLKLDDLIAERVDPSDTTKVLASRRLSAQYFITRFNSRQYTTIFELGSDELFQPGLNQVCRVRFRYEGLPGVVDWFEFKSTAAEWINPAEVRFNGKLMTRFENNEPVDHSYLYVLQ